MISAQVTGIGLLLSMGAKVGQPTLDVYNASLNGVEQPKEALNPLRTSGSMEMTGVYSNPKVSTDEVKFDGSAAQETIEALKAFEDNEFKVISDTVKSKVEQELGRKMADDESFTRLDSQENMQLSKETRQAVRAIHSMQGDLFAMTGEVGSTSALLLPDYIPEELNGYSDIDSTEEAVTNLIQSRVENQLRAIESATDFALNSPLMDIAFNKLGTDGLSNDVASALNTDTSMDDLRLQLFSQQWDRFAQGVTELNWGEQQLFYTSSMYNGFVSDSARVERFA